MHTLDHDEQALIELVHGYVAAQRRRADTPRGLTRERFGELADMDLPSLPFPDTVGGAGVSLRTTTIVVEELARADPLLALGLAGHLAAGLAITALEDDDVAVAAELSVLVTGGRMATAAFADATPGGTPGVAVRGAAAAVNGRLAEVPLVVGTERMVALAADEVGTVHLVVLDSVALASADGPAVSAESSGPLSAGLTTHVRLDGVHATDPAVCLLVPIGRAAAESALSAARLLYAAVAIGTAQGALDGLVAVRSGKLEGTVSVADPLLADRLARATVRCDAARAVVRSAAERRDHAAGVGPHRHTPEAGGGYRTARVCASARLTALDALRGVLIDTAGVLDAAGARATGADLDGEVARLLARAGGSDGALTTEIADDVWALRELP